MISLATSDPDLPLDDLEPLVELVGDAKVVAIGEGTHFVPEFWRMRMRLLHFFAERLGFDRFALEFGFPEAYALDAWLQGAGEPDDLARVSPAADA